MMNEINPQYQDQRTPSRVHTKKTINRQLMENTLKTKDKEKIMNAIRGERTQDIQGNNAKNDG